MSKTELFFFVLLTTFGVGSIVNYFLWWFDFAHLQKNQNSNFSFDLILFILLSFVIWHGLLQRLAVWFLVFHMRKPVYFSPPKKKKVAMLTCFVPGKEPYDLLEKTLLAMTKVTYPHDTWVLDEGDDEVVKDMCNRLGVYHFSRKGKAKYNQPDGPFKAKTKAGNHNAWRDAHEDKYDFVAQMDMDHIPHSDYLDRVLGYFIDQKVAFVVGPQIYTNTENWIARGAAEQSYIFHGPMQQALFGLDTPLFIGTNHVYRPSSLQEVGGYASTIVEDHLTGMRLYAKGWKGVYVPEIIAEGEGPTNWLEYFNQQMRWSYGIFEILFRYSPKLLPQLSFKRRVSYLAAQTYYFVGLVNVVSIFLTSLYLIFGYSASSLDLLGWVKHALPPFLISLCIQLWLQRFYLNPKTESGLGIRGLILTIGASPIYALALFKVLTGQKLQYLVTAKGSQVENKSPWRAFTPHLVIVVLSIFSLITSYLTQNDAPQLRFWGLVNLSLFLLVLVSNFNLDWKILRYASKVPFQRLAVASITVLVLILGNPIYSTILAGRTQTFLSPIAQADPKKVAPDKSHIILGTLSQKYSSDPYLLEEKTGKDFLLLGKYQSWGDNYRDFDSKWAEDIYSKGNIPMISWQPWSTSYKNQPQDQTDFKLTNITSGKFDNYISKYALAVRDWDHPVIIRFAHEMNGNWYPWSGDVNGNTPEDYVAAYRHVYDLFTALGVENVTWVWSPNEPFENKSIPHAKDLSAFYPGDNYVDWVAFSSFNWGTSESHTQWRSFTEVVEPAYKILEKYDKPLMISEINSSTNGGDKSTWLKNMAFEILNFPRIKAVIWFETEKDDYFTIDINPQTYLPF